MAVAGWCWIGTAYQNWGLPHRRISGWIGRGKGGVRCGSTPSHPHLSTGTIINCLPYRCLWGRWVSWSGRLDPHYCYLPAKSFPPRINLPSKKGFDWFWHCTERYWVDWFVSYCHLSSGLRFVLFFHCVLPYPRDISWHYLHSNI